MSIRNVALKNRLSFEFDILSERIKDHIKSNSKLINLTSLNINNINDLIEETIPSIYYMVSWLLYHFKNNKFVKGICNRYFPDDSIEITIILYFMEEVEGTLRQCIEKMYLLDLEFTFEELAESKNVFKKIKKCIKEDLEICDDIAFPSNLIIIKNDYKILHPDDLTTFKKVFI